MKTQNNIKKYVSHFSAAKLWNIPYLDYFLKDEYMDQFKHDPITDITVTNQSLRYSRKNCRIHLNTRPLPRGAIANRNGLIISTPEFIFLELAKELNIYELILFGLQLCSHPPGQQDYAVTTKRKLKEFLKKTCGFDGHLKATQALKYIKNGSNSIMESIVFIVFSLPYRLGGFGFDSICFNSEISLNSSAQSNLTQKRCYVDLFYPEGNLAIEYDSNQHHDSIAKYDKDMLRSNTIKSQGIDVLHITKNQLYRKKSCEQLAYNIAKQSGKRLRYQTKAFYQSNFKLRKLLP